MRDILVKEEWVTVVWGEKWIKGYMKVFSGGFGRVKNEYCMKDMDNEDF